MYVFSAWLHRLCRRGVYRGGAANGEESARLKQKEKNSTALLQQQHTQTALAEQGRSAQQQRARRQRRNSRRSRRGAVGRIGCAEQQAAIAWLEQEQGEGC